ncbi:SLAP domain-containing protein [Lactobacillus kullabergensis]|uniref:SLAP domain-containing protein n=1 Tax=Lactobacillus kullabergensis TaxID=1218493 RepID=UPI0022474715|nr:SLAP domain-containing protein [Lactobacillus kullabergensis]MCX0290651.1 SLAP domain-containing protein [Lactobacillus kullabergensis]
MLGKNNNKERIRKMEMQAKQDHFSIRKLTIGAASVLLGFTFFGLNSQTAKADTIDPAKEEISSETNKSQTESVQTADTADSASTNKQTSSKKQNTDLTTFSGLSSFLKDSETANPTSSTKDSTAKTTDSKTDDQKDKENTTDNSAKTPDQDQSATKDPSKTDGTTDLDNSKTNDTEKTDSQTPALVDKDAKRDATTGTVAKVTNWTEFTDAYKNASVSEIDIMNDIKDGPNNDISYFGDIPGRNLLIKSVGDQQYLIDFKGNHPQIDRNTSADITYENVMLVSGDYYGVFDTDGLNNKQTVNIRFRNTKFYGSQLIYASRNTHIFFYGSNDINTIKTPYFPGEASDANNQQLFQFTNENCSVEFVDGTFKGSTFGGSVIQMESDNDIVQVDQGATVELTPLKDYNGSHGATGEGLMPFSVIYIRGKGKVDVAGKMDINMGDNSTVNPYQGTRNNSKCRAIYLQDTGSSFNIGTNGVVNVTTNGNISDANSGNLIYDGGNFTIRPKGALNVTGQDMGNYSGTLVLVKGKADVENGAFNISLDGSTTVGSGSGAGNKPITLVDVQGGTLIVNNPTSLILNAQANKNSDTSIIGENNITITNVRQQFNLTGLGLGIDKVTLPPFHVLNVRKQRGGTILVDKLELLNGKMPLNNEKLQELITSVTNAGIDFAKLPKDVKDSLTETAASNKTFDDLFIDIIQRAFNNSNNFGYNNIAFIPANPSGFMDIDTSKVTVKRNDDGSNTISGAAGSVIGYNPDTDGPDDLKTDDQGKPQKPKNPFSLVMPVATKAYIVANVIDDKGKKIPWPDKDDKNHGVPNPYAETDDTYRDSKNSSLNPLPTQYAAVVNDDGSFSFTIPADQTVKYNKNYGIELSPSANFVGYDPTDTSKPVRQNLDILTLSEVRDQAAQAITDAINNAKTNKPNNLTADQNKAFNDAMTQAAAAASKTINSANKSTSVYDPTADSITRVNQRRDNALKIINDAITAAKNSAQVETDRTNAINALNAEASQQAGYYPSQSQTINGARDNAISQVKAAQNSSDVAKAKDDGIKAIDKVGLDYKNTVKTGLDQQIGQVKSDIADLAMDANLNDTEKDEVNGLIDRLKRPDAIVATQGDIDKDTNEASVKSHQKEAQDTIDALKNTISAIKKLQAAAKDEIAKHSDKTADIQDSLNDAVHKVINGDDPDGSKGLEEIKQVFTNQEADAINKAAAAAKKRVQNSGLAPADQVAYLNAIDNAAKVATAKPGDSNYDANKSIYGTSDVTGIDQRVAATQTAFDKAAAKSEVSGYAVINEDSLSVNSTTNIAKAINDGLASIDNSTDSNAVATAEDTAKKNVLKAISKQKLADVEADLENQISNIPGLTAQNIDDAKAQAQKILSNNNIPLGYTQRIDQADSLTAIDGARNDGITALNNLLIKQQELGKRNNQLTDAAAQIRQKQQDADKAIDDITNLSDAEKDSYHKQIKKVADDSINGLNSIDSSKVDDAVTTAKGKIDSIVADAQNKGNSVIKDARAKASQAVDDAANAAKAKIESIPDSQLSQSNKKHYEDLIDQDAQSAKDKIAAAQDEDSIKSVVQDGENNITRDLNDAQVSAARAKAISDLQTAKNDARKTISDAHDKGSLNEKDWEDKLDQIDNAYDQAVQAVTGDFNVSDINNDADKGKKSIQSIVDSISDNEATQALAKQRQDAINKLKEARDNANTQITTDPNLSVTEKNDYYNQITNAFNNAQSAIQAAGKDDIDTALTNGTRKLTDIQEAANLQSAKDQALNDLLAERSKVKEQIGNMDQVTSANKNDLRAKVDEQYNQAVNNINSANTSSIQQVTQYAQQGKAAIDNVISDLNINKVINKQKLDDYAQKAIDRINNSTDVTQAVKDSTIAGIKAARDEAKGNVDSQTEIPASNVAEQNGELAIDAAAAKGNGLEGYKNSAIDQISTAAANATSRLQGIYNGLKDDEKAKVKDVFDQANSAIQQASSTAIANVKKATNKDQVDGYTKDAIAAINKAEAGADLAAAKAAAITAINETSAKANTQLTDKKDQDANKAVTNLGQNDINAASDIATVNKIKDNTIQSIQNILDIAASQQADQIRNQRDEALQQLKDTLNGKDNVAGVRDQINRLNDLTDDQKTAFTNQAVDAYNRAVAKVSGASKDQIENEKNAGIVDINQALSDAKLQAAKNKAKSDLDQTASDAGKNDAKDQDSINNERDKAKDKIDQAKNTDEVNKAKDEGQNAIIGIEQTGKDTQLANDKVAAKNDLKNAADKLQQKIDQDLADKKLGQDQYDDLKEKIDQARKDGETRINSAKDKDSLTGAQSQNNNDLNNISTDIGKEESLTNALTQLQDAVNKASAAADRIAKDNKDLAEQMREQIKSERDKAAQIIQNAKNDAQDPNNAMNTAAQDGVKAITGLTDRYEAKNDAINKLKGYAETVKKGLQGNNLDANEISQGENAINTALQNATSNIYGAKDTDNLDDIEGAGEKAIDQAKLPSDLLAEKNKQIAAIDDYVKKKGDINSVATNLTNDQKADLQKQLDQVVQNTKDKIGSVKLPDNPTQSDLEAAKKKLANIEQGVPENNEALNFGQAGVDNVYDVAKNRADIYQAKQDAIKQLQDIQDQANKKIEDSGLSGTDQEAERQKIKDIIDKSKTDINNIPDKNKDGKDRTADDVKQDAAAIVNKAKNGYKDPTTGEQMPGTSSVIDQAALAGAKTKAEGYLKEKQNQAHDIINKSQLTDSEKQEANQAIDDAYNTEKASIEATTDINKVPKDKDHVGTSIDKIWQNSSEWVVKDKQNATIGTNGLQSEYDKLTSDQRANSDYQDYIKDIIAGLADINKADNIPDISSAYNQGITALNKLKAKEDIKNAADKAKTEIINNKDIDSQTKLDLINNVNEHVKEGNEAIDQVNAPSDDPAGKKTNIDKAANTAKGDIQVEVNKAIDASKKKADQEVADKAIEAIDKIHKEFGDNADTSSIQNAFNKHKNTEGNSYDEIQKNKLEAEKEIAKGAVDDAAKNAKKDVDNNKGKHQDGSDLTNDEKQKIKDEIDHQKDNAKDKIDHAGSGDDIDKNRDNGIDVIHQDSSDPTTIDKVIHGGDNNGDNNGNGGNTENIGNGGNTGGGSTVTPGPVNKPGTGSVDAGKDKPQNDDGNLTNSSQVKLMHNAYLYDETGKRANQITLGVGSIVTVYGTQTINGKEYYVLVDQGAKNKKYFVATANVLATRQKLTHNAYIYNQFGKRVKKTGVYKKGQLLNTYGAVVKIRGKRYFTIGKNRFVKAANVKIVTSAKSANEEVAPTNTNTTEQPVVTVAKSLKHNAYLYDENGRRANKLIFNAGSVVETTGKTTINGQKYYALPDGLYIASGNIDAKKLKLKHNAYIYNKYGHRLDKKVLKKHKSVNTYGNPVKIGHKKYYTLSKGRFVKKANF